MVLAAEDKSEVQTALNAIEKWTDENEFTINGSKTVQMTFRKGGRRAEDTITLRNKPLQFVNDFKYLGMTLQTTITSFRLHIKERAIAATKAIYDINPYKLQFLHHLSDGDSYHYI
jgi:hypothetical protein